MATEIRITDQDFVRRIIAEQHEAGERSPVKTVVRLVTERLALREAYGRPATHAAGNQPVTQQDARMPGDRTAVPQHSS